MLQTLPSPQMGWTSIQTSVASSSSLVLENRTMEMLVPSISKSQVIGSQSRTCHVGCGGHGFGLFIWLYLVLGDRGVAYSIDLPIK